MHRYIATRVRAADLGVDWAMMYNPDGSGKERGFKAQAFIDIGKWDKGLRRQVHHFEINQDAYLGHPKDTSRYLPTEPQSEMGFWLEKSVKDEFGNDIRPYDPDFNFVEDRMLIDGEFQDERYWAHHEKDLNEWLKAEPLEVPDDTCVIGFRGGEFSLYPDLFLPESYYHEAMGMMREINPDMKFEVHTDDVALAKEFFPSLPIIHDPSINWRSMRYARHAIVANSSFFILPRWMSSGVTVAPRYWARYNTKVWALPQNYYNRFTYI